MLTSAPGKSDAGWKGNLLPAAQQGLASPEHAAFVKRLATARRGK